MPRRKYNDESLKITDWTSDKLKRYAKSYHDTIYGRNPCYGVRDILILDALLDELARRKILPTEHIEFN